MSNRPGVKHALVVRAIRNHLHELIDERAEGRGMGSEAWQTGCQEIIELTEVLAELGRDVAAINDIFN